MSILDDLGITREELIERTISKILEIPSDYEHLGPDDFIEVSIHEQVRGAIRSKVDSIIELSKAKIQDTISSAIEMEIQKVFTSPFVRVNRFNEPIGEPTTIREMIVDEADNYWKENVDESGKKITGYTVTKQSRAEYFAKKFMGEFYNKELRSMANDMAKDIKSKIPETFANEVAESFKRYFK